MVKYLKPPLSIDSQLDLLLKRGMTIVDRDRARRYLSHISYFRLRGYWIPFEQPTAGADHRFRPGTSFDKVLDLYIFDRKFRLLMLEGIERVEVSFRAHFANELGLRYGTHFYLDSSHFRNKRLHDDLMTSLKAEIERSKETFIEHYRTKYSHPTLPPVWAVSEIMSFGQLSIWYRNLKLRKDRGAVARHYRLDESILRSFMHHLTHIRNIVAHHGRLWNRRLTITMSLPKNPGDLEATLHQESARYIGNTVIVLGWLLREISPGTTWPERMRQLMDAFPAVPSAAMGFHNNWRELPLWQSS